MSYTSFSYNNLKIQDQGTKILVSFNLKNTGKISGDEVAQVYVKLPNMNIVLPVKQLKGFKRINIKSGKTEKISIELDRQQLRYWDESQSKFVSPKGEYTIMVGASSEDIRLTQTINLQ
jgi:beta-glucosidase